MLPAAHRLRSSADFTAVTRRGRRASSRGLVVYLLAGSVEAGDRMLADQTTVEAPVKVGLIVGRSVGGSVVRHQVSRRLRAQLASRVATLPSGAKLVVRALPAITSADSAELGRSLDQAVGRLTAGARR
ncbi:MAG: ribonuclease P protein component [Jatrophihabitantaceae bacterium]